MVGRFKEALLEKGKMPKKFSVKSGDKSKEGGLTSKGVKRYRAANPGSKLKTAVTTEPSKLKKDSKSANRRKSFCARMGGMKKRLTSAKTRRNPDSRINKALRKWNCSTDVNPNTLDRMSESIHNAVAFELFLEGRNDRVASLLECAIDSIDQITDEMIDDALLMESVLTPIIFEEINNPLNESAEDFEEIVIRRFDEKVNPAAIKIPARPSFRSGLKRGIYDAGSKLAKGIGRGVYDAGARVATDVARGSYQGAKNFYKGLSGDTPIGTRLGTRLRQGLGGLRKAADYTADKVGAFAKPAIDKAGYSLGKKVSRMRQARGQRAAERDFNKLIPPSNKRIRSPLKALPRTTRQRQSSDQTPPVGVTIGDMNNLSKKGTPINDTLRKDLLKAIGHRISRKAANDDDKFGAGVPK
tara:strand:+ start:207 stop:1445 length:1239 start_codon:yes stop_codon:yes gene_type:complete